MADARDVRFVAFHLPQFHPIPENDEWWGPGFTEWRNVVRARPRVPGHAQPDLPADLGFYDLRLPSALEAQAELARAGGIDGFCYYHYWFNGRRVLERPVSTMLSSGRPDFPFMLCWANENWTRAWDGKETDVLLAQHYSADDDVAHMTALIPYFRDPRYIRIDGRPVFLVYRTRSLPDPAATAARWRDVAAHHGLPGLFLCTVESAGWEVGDARPLGFDAAVDFQPRFDLLGPRQGVGRRDLLAARLRPTRRGKVDNAVFHYGDLVANSLAREEPAYPCFPGVTPGWDNSPRRQSGARILTGSTPELYERWLGGRLARYEPPASEANLFFVNAWNEWAEGNHLEPGQQWGPAHLAVHRRLRA